MCKILQWIEKERILSEKIFMTSLQRNLIMLFEDNLQLRQYYLKRRLNWTEENGKDETLILLFMKLATA